MRRVVMRAPRARRGLTLAESLIGIVVAGIIGVVIMTLAIRQSALGAAAIARTAARAQWAEARALLAGDLAAVGQGSARLVSAHDTAIELDAHVGVALACRAAPAGTRTITVTAQDGSGAVPTDGWLRAVATGDSVLAFDPANGAWVGGPLSSASSGTCPPGVLAGAGRALALASALTADVPIGAPVQLRRRVRWNAYRGADGRWYLGVRERTNGAWAIVQPAAGPLDASAGRPRPFALLDAAGAPLATSGVIGAAAALSAQLAMIGDAASDRAPIIAPIRRRP